MMILCLAAFAILGAILGSFIGVLAERVHTGQRLARDRSRCNSCNRTLGFLDLIPVVSWLVMKGRCRSCGSSIPAAYLILELILAALFALTYYTLGLTFVAGALLLVLSILAFIVVYDLRHTLVPPIASLLLALASLLYLFLSEGSGASLGPALITAGIIGLGFAALYFVSSGRWMGLGDAPVAFSLSLIAAPYAVPGLLFSFWTGALCGILILVLRRGGPTMGIEVPFVPFLAAGYLLAYFTQWNPLPF